MTQRLVWMLGFVLTAASASAQPEAVKPVRVTLPVTMRLRVADLELLACKAGRVHESLVILRVEPDEFMKMMTAAGFHAAEDWNKMPGGADLFVEHWGDRLIAWVEWTIAGKTVRRRAEDLIRDVTQDRILRRNAWIFSGLKGGDEVEMPLTFKGLNAKDAFATFVVHPMAYLEESYRMPNPYYRTASDRLPEQIDKAPAGIPANLILERTTEERLVQLEIDAATTEAEKKFQTALLEPARRVDAAKARARELAAKHAALLRKGLELSTAPDKKDDEIRRLEFETRGIEEEVRMLLKQARRDLLVMELAHGKRELADIEADVAKFKDVLGDDAAGWKKRALAEIEINRNSADHEQQAADRRRERNAKTAEWLGKGVRPPDAVLDELEKLRLAAAVSENLAEVSKAEIKRLREQFNLDLENTRNAEILKAGMPLSEFAKEIITRLKLHVDEATTRQEHRKAVAAAARQHIAWLDAPEAGKPAAKDKLAELQKRALCLGMKHRIRVLDEEIDDLGFEMSKRLGEPEEEAKFKKEIDARTAGKNELLKKIAEMCRE